MLKGEQRGNRQSHVPSHPGGSQDAVRTTRVTSSALRKSSGGQLTAQLCEINGAHAVKMWAYHTLLTM
jgi:hypothetical protein